MRSTLEALGSGVVEAVIVELAEALARDFLAPIIEDAIRSSPRQQSADSRQQSVSQQ